jgi:tellurite resistance protein TerC
MNWVYISWLDKPLWLWFLFITIIIGLLALDLGVLHRRQHIISIKESLKLSAFYIIIGLLFGLWTWYLLGVQSAHEYFTGYIVEKSLSLDNIFVISLIFTYFNIPRQFQHRVLFWGILGVIVLRGIMIGLGTALILRFEWVIYVFALFLILTGIKMLIISDHATDFDKNIILKFMRKHLRLTPNLHGQRFAVLLPSPHNPNKKVLYFTPLLLALALIEVADVIFAVDSVPAIFAITLDPYIVYTSNIFAILGLRALYFALSAIIHRFIYLKYALALILIFIGSKVYLPWLLNIPHVSTGFSLGVTILLLAGGILTSLYKTHNSRDNS